MDTINSMVITRGKGGWKEVEEGMRGKQWWKETELGVVNTQYNIWGLSGKSLAIVNIMRTVCVTLL